MTKKEKNRQSLRNIRTIQFLMILGFAVIVIAGITIVTKLAVKKTDEVLKNKVISLTSSLGVQMKLNMDGYLSRMETIATLAFGEEAAYTYDATDPNNDEYESLGIEKTITDKMYSLCIMENFVDYGIVYRNNRTVGKISNGTATLFGDKIFSELSGMITRARTEDGWFTGYEGNFKRIYYVKKVHENAVLVISFYANELNTVFDNPETLGDMDIRLVNQDFDIIYSKNGSEVGEHLPDDIMTRIDGQTSASRMDNEYLVSVNRCGTWYVICSIPTKIILKDKNEMTQYIYITGFLASLAAALIGFELSLLLISPVKKLVLSLDDKARIDLLTGILNKLTFEEYAVNCFERAPENEPHALIILDLDNFKGVNDTLGHAEGDKVLERTGEILRSIFPEDDYLGRIGGDEFCVLVNSCSSENDDIRGYVTEKCTALRAAFENNYAGEKRDHKISASMGAAFFPEDGRTFSELYTACDTALYKSKKSGKDTFSFYGAEDEKDERVESEVVQ